MQKKRSPIVMKDYQHLTTLGQGSFGIVKLAKHKKTNQYSCVKILRKEEIIGAKQVDHIHNEFKILNSISHPFIVDFHGLAQDSRNIYMFMEYVQGGELFSHLRDQGVFQPIKAAFYSAHIVLIFQFLHSQNIIYRDLKPQNILVAVDGYLKLADFGFAKTLDSAQTYTICGTPQYLAPQIVMNKGHGKPVDWWTLGVLLYEMIAGVDPFCDEDPLKIYQKIISGKVLFPVGFDLDAKSLVKHLLTSDLSKRYGNLKNGVKDIKNHRFMNTTNLTHLLAKKLCSPFKPNVKGPSDTKHFQTYEDSRKTQAKAIPEKDDPFLKWE